TIHSSPTPPMPQRQSQDMSRPFLQFAYFLLLIKKSYFLRPAPYFLIVNSSIGFCKGQGAK
ncbi:MAG: hypothetical protein ACI4PH_10910, partial [Faecousia sp.]